jgi:hypothetical protein
MGFQTYFNQVSLGCRHSGINTPAQTRGSGGRKEGSQPAIKKLGIWVVKEMNFTCFILS